MKEAEKKSADLVQSYEKSVLRPAAYLIQALSTGHFQAAADLLPLFKADLDSFKSELEKNV